MDKKKYIQTVTEQIRCKRALPLVTKELEGHIEDQKSDYMKAGMNVEEAEEAAVLEMGDPVEALCWAKRAAAAKREAAEKIEKRDFYARKRAAERRQNGKSAAKSK